jgi:predicted enzyme related to lactoylglutathione lyase
MGIEADSESGYTQLFGWTTQDMPMGDFNYTIAKADVEVAGK